MAIKPLQMPDLSQLPDPTKDMFGGMTSPTALMTMGDNQANDLLNPKPLFEQNVKLSSQAQQTLNSIAQQQQAIATETDRMAEQVRRQQQEAVAAQIKASQNQVKENERLTKELLEEQEKARKEKAKQQGGKLGAGADGSFVLTPKITEMLQSEAWNGIVSDKERTASAEYFINDLATQLRSMGATDEQVNNEAENARKIVSANVSAYRAKMNEDGQGIIDLAGGAVTKFGGFLSQAAGVATKGWAGIANGGDTNIDKSDPSVAGFLDFVGNSFIDAGTSTNNWAEDFQSTAVKLKKANADFDDRTYAAANPETEVDWGKAFEDGTFFSGVGNAVKGGAASIKRLWDNDLMLNTVADFVPQLVGTMGTGMLTKQAIKPTIAKIALAEASGETVKLSARLLTGTVATKYGVVNSVAKLGSAERLAMGAYGTAMGVTDAGVGAYEQVMGADAATIEKHYGKTAWGNLLKEHNGNVKDAKKELASSALYNAVSGNAPVAAISSMFGIESAIGGLMARKAIRESAEQLVSSGIKGTATRVAKWAGESGLEAVSEGFEEGYTQYQSNLGANPYTGVNPYKGVTDAVALGSFLGAASTGVMNAIDGTTRPKLTNTQELVGRFVQQGYLNYDQAKVVVGRNFEEINKLYSSEDNSTSLDTIHQMKQRYYDNMVDGELETTTESGETQTTSLLSLMTPEQRSEFNEWVRLQEGVNTNNYAVHQDSKEMNTWANGTIETIRQYGNKDLTNAYRLKNGIELDQIPQERLAYTRALLDTIEHMETVPKNLNTRQREEQYVLLRANRLKPDDSLSVEDIASITTFAQNILGANSRRMTDEQQVAYARVQQAVQQVQDNQQGNQNGTQEQNQTSASQPTGQSTVAENVGTVASQGYTNGAGASDTLGTIATQLATDGAAGQGSDNAQSVGNDPVGQTPVASSRADNTATSGTSPSGDSQGLGETPPVGDTRPATTPTSNSKQIAQQGVARQTSQGGQPLRQTGPSTTQTPVSGGSVGATSSERNTNGGSQQAITQANINDGFLADPANATYVKSFINVAYNDLGKFGQGVTKHKADLRRLAGITGVEGGKLSGGHIDALYNLINLTAAERTTLINNEFRTQAATNRVHNAVHHLKQNVIKIQEREDRRQQREVEKEAKRVAKLQSKKKATAGGTSATQEQHTEQQVLLLGYQSVEQAQNELVPLVNNYHVQTVEQAQELVNTLAATMGVPVSEVKQYLLESQLVDGTFTGDIIDMVYDEANNIWTIADTQTELQGLPYVNEQTETNERPRTQAIGGTNYRQIGFSEPSTTSSLEATAGTDEVVDGEEPFGLNEHYDFPRMEGKGERYSIITFKDTNNIAGVFYDNDVREYVAFHKVRDGFDFRGDSRFGFTTIYNGGYKTVGNLMRFIRLPFDIMPSGSFERVKAAAERFGGWRNSPEFKNKTKVESPQYLEEQQSIPDNAENKGEKTPLQAEYDELTNELYSGVNELDNTTLTDKAYRLLEVENLLRDEKVNNLERELEEVNLEINKPNATIQPEAVTAIRSLYKERIDDTRNETNTDSAVSTFIENANNLVVKDNYTKSALVNAYPKLADYITQYANNQVKRDTFGLYNQDMLNMFDEYLPFKPINLVWDNGLPSERLSVLSLAGLSVFDMVRLQSNEFNRLPQDVKELITTAYNSYGKDDNISTLFTEDRLAKYGALYEDNKPLDVIKSGDVTVYVDKRDGKYKISVRGAVDYATGLHDSLLSAKNAFNKKLAGDSRPAEITDELITSVNNVKETAQQETDTANNAVQPLSPDEKFATDIPDRLNDDYTPLLHVDFITGELSISYSKDYGFAVTRTYHKKGDLSYYGQYTGDNDTKYYTSLQRAKASILLGGKDLYTKASGLGGEKISHNALQQRLDNLIARFGDVKVTKPRTVVPTNLRMLNTDDFPTHAFLYGMRFDRSEQANRKLRSLATIDGLYDELRWADSRNPTSLDDIGTLPTLAQVKKATAGSSSKKGKIPEATLIAEQVAAHAIANAADLTELDEVKQKVAPYTKGISAAAKELKKLLDYATARLQKLSNSQQETENETQQTGGVGDGNQSADTRTQDENGTDPVGNNPKTDEQPREVFGENRQGNGSGAQASGDETTYRPLEETQGGNEPDGLLNPAPALADKLTDNQHKLMTEVASNMGTELETLLQNLVDGSVTADEVVEESNGKIRGTKSVERLIDTLNDTSAEPQVTQNPVDEFFAKSPKDKQYIETYLHNRREELLERLNGLKADDAAVEQIDAAEAEIKALPKNAREAAESMLADNIAFTDMVSRLDFDVASEQTNQYTADVTELFSTAERMVRDVVGDSYFDSKIKMITRTELNTLRQLDTESDVQHNIMGFHRNGKIYLLPENFQQKGMLNRIVKTAVHEAGHEKIFASGRKQWHELFKAAYESNPTLKAVADKQIAKYRKANYGSRAASDLGFGIEEAIVDMYGYLVNDMYSEFKKEYGVDLPVEETRSFFKDLFAKLRMMFAKLTGWKPSEFSDQDIITIIGMINNVDTVTPTFSLSDKLSFGGLPTETADTLIRMWNSTKQGAATVSMAAAVTLGSTFVVPNVANAATPVETATVQHIVQTNDNQGKSFIVADKQAGTLTVYNAAGQELTSTPALFGKNVGDSITAKNTTPSGRYDLTRATNINNSAYGNSAQVLTVNGQMQANNAGNLAIHRVLTSFPSENRVGRLDSATASDNRISHGCINVPASFYDTHLDNVGDAVVYVLPETAAGRKGVFSSAGTSDLSRSETSAGVPTQQNPAPQATTVAPQMDNANAQSVEVKPSDIQSASATYDEPKQAPVKALAPITIAGTQPSGQVAYVAPVVVGGITADQINIPFAVHTPAEMQANGVYDTEPVSGSLRSDGGDGFNIYEIAAWLAGIGATVKTISKRRKKKLSSRKNNEQPTTDNANEETVTSEQNPSGTDRNEQAQAAVDDNHNDKVNKSVNHVITNAQAPSQKTQIADAVTRAMWIEYIANAHLPNARDENGNVIESGDVYSAFIDSMLGFEWAIDDVMRDRTIEQANDGTFADPMKWRNEISNKKRAGISAKLMNWAAGATQVFDNLMTEHGIARVGHEMDSSIPSKHLAQIKTKASGAYAQIHKLYVKPLVLKADILAGNLRMGYVELEKDIGNVATVKHILNEAADAMWRGREHIIQTHQEQLDAVNQAIANTDDGNEIRFTLSNKARLLQREIREQTELLNKARDMYNGVTPWDGKTGMPGGYTKAQAEKALADLKSKYGSDFSQVEQLATETVQTIRGIRNFATAAGVFSNADLQTFRDLGFTEYVPLYAEQKNPLEVDETDAYTKQSYMDKLTADLPAQEARAMGLTKNLSRYHREGATTPAADAFTNMKVFSMNMAGRIGQQGWLNSVQQLYEGTVGKPISATGITDEELLKELNAGSASGKLPGLIRVRPGMEQFEGIDTNKFKPIVAKGHNAHGEVVTYHYYFTEPAIQAEIYSNSDLTETLLAKGLRNVGTLTRVAARMMTTFKPVWHVYNWARDSLERISIMLMRPVKDKNGNLVNKWGLSKAYFKHLAVLASSPSAQSEIYRYLILGETKTKLQKILHEAVGEGAINLITSQTEKHSIIADLNKSTVDKLYSQAEKLLGEGFNKIGAGKLKRGANQLADMYIMRLTEVPQITTALSAYMAYQDVGVNKGETANRVRDQYDPLRANNKVVNPATQLFPFIRSTLSGHYNLGRTLSEYWKPGTWQAPLAYMVVGTLGTMAVLTMMSAMFGDDEDGVPKLARLPIGSLMNGIPVPIGDDGVWSLPVGFGLNKLAWGIGANLWRQSMGMQTGGETAKQLLGLVADNTSPTQFASGNIMAENPVTGMALTLTPLLAKPLMEIATNTKSFGGAKIITRETPKDQYDSEQDNFNTPETYKTWVRALRETTGIDMRPETMKHLFESYSWGPLGAVPKSVIQDQADKTLGNRERKGEVFGPLLTAIGADMAIQPNALDYAQHTYAMQELRMELHKRYGVGATHSEEDYEKYAERGKRGGIIKRADVVTERAMRDKGVPENVIQYVLNGMRYNKARQEANKKFTELSQKYYELRQQGKDDPDMRMTVQAAWDELEDLTYNFVKENNRAYFELMQQQ